jgi:hypothetical protein
MNVWWGLAGGAFTVWAGYTLYRTGYRDGWSDAAAGRPERRW